MEITFQAQSASIDTAYGLSNINLTVEADGREVAEALDLDDRLYGLGPSDIISEFSRNDLLETIGEDGVREWLLANSNPDDTLEYIGLDKIHEFLSHGEPDGNSPV